MGYKKNRNRSNGGYSLTQIPHANGVVITATGDSITIRTERYALDIIRMPCERADMCAIACVPQSDSVVITHTCDCLTIRTERYAVDKTQMPSDRVDKCAIARVPQTDNWV